MFSMRSDMRNKIEGCIDYLKEQEASHLEETLWIRGNPYTLERLGWELGLTRESYTAN